jgi:hypothetical protein
MKKLLAAITIAAIFAISPSAMAAGAKMPKLLCLDWESWTQQLSFKAIGTVYINGAKVKTYAINGMDESGPLTGTAYIIPDSTTLRASYTTTYTGEGWVDPVDASYNLVFNLATGTGTLDYRFANPPNNALNYGSYPTSSVDCIAASMAAEAGATGINDPAAQ